MTDHTNRQAFLDGYMQKQAMGAALATLLLAAIGGALSIGSTIVGAGVDTLRRSAYLAAAIPPMIGLGAAYGVSRVTSPSEDDLTAAKNELVNMETEELNAELRKRRALDKGLNNAAGSQTGREIHI